MCVTSFQEKNLLQHPFLFPGSKEKCLEIFGLDAVVVLGGGGRLGLLLYFNSLCFQLFFLCRCVGLGRLWYPIADSIIEVLCILRTYVFFVEFIIP